MRLLHTMLRVGNLEKSLNFYQNVLGMKLLRRHDYPEGRFTLAFVGYGSEAENTVLELTHNWDTESYDLGNAYGHIAIEDIFYSFDDSISPEIVFRSRSESRQIGVCRPSLKGACYFGLIPETLVLVVDRVCALYYVLIESSRVVGNIRCGKCLYRRRYDRHFRYLNIVDMQIVIGVTQR